MRTKWKARRLKCEEKEKHEGQTKQANKKEGAAKFGKDPPPTPLPPTGAKSAKDGKNRKGKTKKQAKGSKMGSGRGKEKGEGIGKKKGKEDP